LLLVTKSVASFPLPFICSQMMERHWPTIGFYQHMVLIL
jgi:hypothetical protein